MSKVRAAYDALISGGELRPDPAQTALADRLDALATKLERKPRTGFLGRLLGGKPAPVRGLYLWGGVGRGKSMLMDLFYTHADVHPRVRIHFHQFMLETHARIHAARQSDPGDPIPIVARQWAEEARLLCFDELQVNNVADAMILSRLFTTLLEGGVTIVATSNRAPKDLYKDGLNRELFLPFIALLERDLDVVPLDGPTDYRLHRLGGMPTYYTPNGPAATQALSDLFFRLTDFPVEDRDRVPSEDLGVGGGRILHVPKSVKGVAVFSFKRLCGEARGAADYLAVARAYHTVILVGVPVLGPENRNEASRFVTLIDALYEWRCKLLIAADAPPEKLYPEGDGRFEFDRTVSRLMEMQSADYLAEGHGLRV
ncbi:cell division protein ZapE [Sandaracinobacteroides hominis]|uniref:cell division protein ZapE n=1 Tax=Sandaracinobacteroides hominis TaxID=2780086 RepID=UPI0018F454A1|nr:cell division protein ZapE [Sandaracinobacteroides hominis]